MIYVYNDFGGTHTTSIAAAYHLRKLPENRVLTKEEILNVPYFNKLEKSDAGKFIFHGKDEDGHSVYTLGRRSSKLIIPSLKNFYEVLEDRFQLDEKIIFSNTSPTVPFAMTMGGFFSRGLKIDFIGVPLLVAGAKKSCLNIHKLVENTKQIGSSAHSKVTVIENKNFQA
ncbi:DUF3189 family protein [Cytobacillus depressus]|uniref:DUF3189 family protein n=1 Tax=Cytobacillus depressus TaxID=1602942 RepID=A0A6L3UZY1_9BACI|nr:DUF3189 family protein [Cytobacillus depressus]KAB2330182.1 DUF3189 family protein [Cytobacillus depressus]